MTTDLMMVQALVRGLMKFVVKEFLSARFVGYPQALTRLDRFLLNSFPFEFSRQRFGEDSRRTGIPKATAKCAIRFISRYFWPFVASNDGERRALRLVRKFRRPRARCEANSITFASRDDDGATACRCRGRYLQLQVGPALTRT
jgi:hypothetical protein